MKKSILLLAMIVIVCSACSMFNKYEGYMRQAKESMREGNYEKSIDFINNALIEEPTSKDALALKVMAEEALQKEINEAEKAKFIEMTTPFYEKLLTLTKEINEDASNLSISQAEKLLPEVEDVQRKLADLSNEWKDSDTYNSAFQHLNGATDSLKLCLVAVIENISEPIIENENSSDFDIVRQTLNSNDSKIRARLSFREFSSKMQRFHSELPND